MTFPAHGFVLLALPKTASTALERTLAPHADLVVSSPPGRKHIPARGFHHEIAPQLAEQGHPRDSYEVVTMFREPVSWLESWWRYRGRRDVRPGRSTDGISFEDYAVAYLSGDRSVPTPRGRPSRFLMVAGTVGVDRIFSIERPDVWQAWFAERIGRPLQFERRNVSPDSARGTLSAETRRALEAHFVPERFVWDRLAATGQWAGARGATLPDNEHDAGPSAQ